MARAAGAAACLAFFIAFMTFMAFGAMSPTEAAKTELAKVRLHKLFKPTCIQICVQAKHNITQRGPSDGSLGNMRSPIEKACRHACVHVHAHVHVHVHVHAHACMTLRSHANVNMHTCMRMCMRA